LAGTLTGGELLTTTAENPRNSLKEKAVVVEGNVVSVTR